MYNISGYRIQIQNIEKRLNEMIISDIECIDYIEVSKMFLRDLREKKEFKYLPFKAVTGNYLHLNIKLK